MGKYFGLIFAIGLVGCAARGPTESDSALSEWNAYRTEVLRQRDQDKLDPAVAEERIQQRYQELWGDDPVVDGAFAYALKLYEAADMGDLSVAEADQLAQPHIDEAISHREFDMPLYVFPPEASD